MRKEVTLCLRKSQKQNVIHLNCKEELERGANLKNNILIYFFFFFFFFKVSIRNSNVPTSDATRIKVASNP